MKIHGADAAGVAPGVCILRLDDADEARLDACLSSNGVADIVYKERVPGGAVRLSLTPDIVSDCCPGFDTLGLRQRIDRLAAGGSASPLEKEVLLAMLSGPLVFPYPTVGEWLAAMAIRCNIATAAAKTRLAFDTESAERPEAFFRYIEDRGFCLQPGVSLMAALEQATRPDISGALYSFSCYRATEYILLLAMVTEMARSNPRLLDELTRLWQSRAIMSGEFHEVFLVEYGSIEEPLPPNYFIPGDRVWFRNPDERSADVTGYEGSWVFYLGNGEFSNFWKEGQPYTMQHKCLELFHWRHGFHLDDDGEPRINEDEVEARVTASLNDPDELKSIMATMSRHREPRGVYRDGGCIDVSRECARRICAGTTDIVLPSV